MDGGGRGGGRGYGQDRGHYGGGGGGGGRQNNRNRRGAGRGRGFRHQPYNNRSRGPPRGGRGNRFGGGQTYQDPQTLMVRQVYSFVSRVGEFKNIRDSEESPDSQINMRPVVSTTAANINDLTAVLCAEDKLEMLLKFQAPATEGMEGSSTSTSTNLKPEEKVGKLVHLVVSCAAALPLQTPCYAALTLAVHEQVKGSQWAGFVSRCVEYTMLNIAVDLDTVLLLGNKSQAQATCRIKLMLRYLAILGKMGIVKSFEGEEAEVPQKMTVFGLLSLLVELATAATEQHNNSTAANILSILVLSTLPYIMDYVPREVMSEKLLKPIESILETYKSTFTPGLGVSSILLKDAQLEDDDDDDDEEEEEEEEADDEEAPGQICDSLQDLLRASQRLSRNEGEPTRFALPLDAPWKGLARRSTPNPEGGETESHPITFSEEPFYLSFTNHESQAITLLLGGGETQLKLQCFNLEGVVFGRLPIFGSPPDPEDDDEEEEDMEEGAAKNEQLQAFVKKFSILDRYFVAETMRDCLISHESNVNATGVQQGSAKTAAEELLSICHMFSGEKASAGLEYAILETLFALIAQSTEYGSLRHIFLSRVLLELTRLEPSRLSPALTVAMTNLFQDYLPALAPTTRENFSRWFAFHLINTDYQWPSAYWKLWEPYATSLKPSSRGSFVRRALNVMAENVCDPAIISSQCLSEAKSLAAELFGRTTAPSVTAADDGPIAAALEIEIHRRIWDNDEDQTLLHDYLVGEEVDASLGAATDQTNGGDWSRTDVLIRVIVDPARQMHEGLKNSLEKSDADDDDDMADDDALSKDVHVIITGCIARYKQSLLGAIAKDAESLGGDKDDMIVLGGAFLLRRIESVASFSPNLLEAIVACLVKHRVVSDFAVLRWVLGDLGDSVTGDVVPRWWTYAADTLQESLSFLESDTTGGGSMVVDGGGMDSDEEFSSQATKLLNQMLQYAVKRVCSLLVTGQGDEKRLNPLQVELVEGMKTLAVRSKLLLVSVLTRSVGMRKAMMVHEVHEMLAKSEICGSMIAGLCTGHESSSAVNLLQRSLEKV